MTANLVPLVRQFAGLRALVIGDAMLDSYSQGEANRLCREAPVPIVALAGRQDAPGGAANTAANLAALGAETSLLAVIGEDHDGARLRTVLARGGVDDRLLVAEPGRATLSKHRISAGAQMLVRLDQGDTRPVSAGTASALAALLRPALAAAEVVIISDYAYGLVTPGVLAAIAAHLPTPRPVLVVDARDPRRFSALQPDLVKPNYDEAAALLNLPPSDTLGRVEAMSGAGAALLLLTGARVAALTMDSDGALVFERGQPPYRTFTRRPASAAPAGAGDTYAAAFGLALAAGAATVEAAEVAAEAAALVVARGGTAVAPAAELIAALDRDRKTFEQPAALAAALERHRQEGRSVVFTNGCFDILHSGHVACLTAAKALGDVLVVAVNTDASVAQLKGPARPINPLQDRLEVLAALSCVDYLIPFGDATPARLIEAVRPNVYAKGGDYTPDSLPEAPTVRALGGEVRIIPYVEDHSTTGILSRIQRSVPAGGSL